MNVQQAIDAGLAHQQAGRLAEAERAFRAVLAVEPANPDALNLLGALAHETGHLHEAVDLIGRALRILPDNPVILNNYAQALRAIGRNEDALEILRCAAQIEPSIPQVHENIAVLLLAKHDQEGAEREFAEQVRLAPFDAMARTNHGYMLHQLGRLDDALAEHREALRLHSNLPDAHNNLAAVYRDLDRPEDALTEAEEALRLRPNYVNAMSTRDSALYDLGRPKEAIRWAQRAIDTSPDFALAHRNKGMALLSLGDFENGFPEYEWREQPATPLPRWDGAPLNGRHIIVLAEQGLGDSILMARFAQVLSQPPHNATVTWQCPYTLEALLQTAPGIARACSVAELAPKADLYIPTMSLPGVLKITPQTIPAHLPYLSVDPQRAAQWRTRIEQADPQAKLRVGLAWASRPGTGDFRKRSLKLAQLAPLASVANVTFYSLQKEDFAKEASSPPANMRLIDWTADLRDFSDTAALVDCLDLVITVDTAVCNLAGALAKPTWTMLPRVCDWRWFWDRTDTPWYPTMRLFRQPSRGDWAGVLGAIAEELQILRSGR